MQPTMHPWRRTNGRCADQEAPRPLTPIFMSAPLLRRIMAAALKTLVHRRVPAQAQAYVIEVSVRRGYPGEGTFEKGGGAVLALVWQDLAIGEPAGIINADVQALPANAVMAMDRARPPPK
jgi:hypothetical protein